MNDTIGAAEGHPYQNVLIRIFSPERADTACGDRVVTGASIKKNPPENSLIVYEVVENYDTSRRLWHTKLLLR